MPDNNGKYTVKTLDYDGERKTYSAQQVTVEQRILTLFLDVHANSGKAVVRYLPVEGLSEFEITQNYY